MDGPKFDRLKVKVPAQLYPAIKARAQELGYKSVARYILSLVMSDLWVRFVKR